MTRLCVLWFLAIRSIDAAWRGLLASRPVAALRLTAVFVTPGLTAIGR